MSLILITGSTGQVGSALMALSIKKGLHAIGTTHKQLNITDDESVEYYISKYNPSLVINAAAYTDVDKAEEDIDNAFLVNKIAVANLARACQKKEIPLLHISTDYIFSGDKTIPYTELDDANPESIYGDSKLAGEKEIQRFLDKYIILRTSWVFSSVGKNFPKSILHLARERESLSIVDDQFGGPTWAGDIAKVLMDIADNYLQKKNMHWGVYHYSGAPVTNWFEFAKEIMNRAKTLNIIDSMPGLLAIPSEAYPALAGRPKYAVLDCSKISQTYGINQVDWHIGLDKVLAEWKTQ